MQLSMWTYPWDILDVGFAGADAINYYNYGLIPAARMKWIRQAGKRIGVPLPS